MERVASMGLAIVALLLGMWNVLALNRIQVRLDGLEAAGPPAATVAPRRDDGAPRTADVRERAQAIRAAAEEAEIDLREADLKDPEVRGRIVDVMRAEADRQSADRQERFRESLTAELEVFAAEHDLDEGTVGRVLGELQRRSDAFADVRQDVRDGHISFIDARRELESLRGESDVTLRGLLGDERFEQLDAQLWGQRGFGPPNR
ncbi:MAG: hypothetical protein KTR31_22985 [Myxococcales bacterium]|nr:hypothetical protein [Myxococcales bacterium]